MISINKDRIIEYKTNCTSNDFAFSADGYTFLTLLILPDITNENENNTPLKLAEKLKE